MTEDRYIDALLNAVSSQHDVFTFLHNTKTEQNAKNIITNGFNFQSHLDYTTDVVSATDVVTIRYFALVRNAYGNFTIIIQISRQLIEHYSVLLANLPYHFSEILSITPPARNADEEPVYTLAQNFIKGYINATTGQFTKNNLFDPGLISPVFNQNLERILLNKK